MINWFYQKMYISLTDEENEIKNYHNVTIINKECKHFKLFLWAYHKSIESYYIGDYQDGNKFLSIAESYFYACL